MSDVAQAIRWFVFGVALLILVIFTVSLASARDDGRYAGSPLHDWFNSLTSGGSHIPCCSLADGRTVEDPDWGGDGKHYWVVVDGKKIEVPDEAVVTVPNRFGRAVVWPYTGDNGVTYIRCFMPGVMG